jgi:putative membrane protein
LLLSPETVLLVVASLVLGVVVVALDRMGGVAAVGPVVVGFGLTQIRRLFAYYDFTVTSSPADGLQVRRGLLDLSSATINLSRVQGLVVTQPFMWRSLGWSRLDVSIAGQTGHEEHGRPSASTVMPVAPHGLVLLLARRLLVDAGSPDPEAVVLTAPPARAGWVAPVRWRYHAFGADEQLLVSRKGILTRRTHVVPHARVQSRRFRQGPAQRHLGLADLLVDSPPGPVKVRARHRDAGEVSRMLNDRRPRPVPNPSGQMGATRPVRPV